MKLTRAFAMSLLLAAAFWTSGRAPARGQAAPGDVRLYNLATELIVETGARTAACDVLLFTPDGKSLLAAGDDKVVRVWPFRDKTGLDLDSVRALRWSAYREQRGSIFALALGGEGKSVAVAGLGLRPGAVAVLDWSGDVKHGITAATTDRISQKVTSIWSLAYSPSGAQLSYGGVDGSVWVWRPGPAAPRRLGTHPGREGMPRNEVRLVVFTGETELLSVAADGWVCAWDTRREEAAPSKRFRFGVTNVIAAAVDPGQRWLAAGGQDRNARVIEVRSLDGRRSKRLETPEDERLSNFPRCLAFDARGERLAVGYYSIPRDATFQKIVGGGVALYDLTRDEPRPSPGPPSTDYPEAVAFHPGGNSLAVADGDDHEVTVWDLKRLRQPLSRAVSPGRCLWGVGLSKDLRLLGFRDERAKDPASPNDRGAGDWKVFDLEKRTWALPPAQAFTPVKPLRGVKGWSVIPDRRDSYVWRVRDSEGRLREVPLDRGRDGPPRCYTFLDGDPVRLVVGHYWGMSVFELGGGAPRLVRKFVGHQGEVMAVAPSADQKLLVSASRDQTISCWRLTGWPNQRELGASFSVDGDHLVVDAVAAGSPAWEARLEKGDEVILLAVDGRKIFDLKGSKKYGPARGKAADCLPFLEKPVPGHELYFGVRRPGAAAMVELLTTVRQRPLWRFFPTRDREWVLWRYHDFYYDTSTNGDFFIGWQLSGEVNTRPAFDRAEQFRQRFHRPDKVAELLTNLAAAPDRVSPLEIEPPRVTVRANRSRVTDDDVQVIVTAAGTPALGVGQVSLWVNDYLVDEWNLQARSVRKEVTIPNRLLRRGKNLVMAQGFNRAGGRRDAEVAVECGRTATRPDLYTLAVGVGDYSKAGLHELSADRDAEAVSAAWKEQAGKLFNKTYPRVLKDDSATRERILAAMHDIGQRAKADDVLVLFLGGHGASDAAIKEATDKRSVPLLDRLEPRTFVFCPYNFDMQKPLRTGVTGKLIYQELRKLPCRKIVMLDACHSGTLGLDPVRELAPAAVGPVVYSACAPEQLAAESRLLGLQYTQDRARGLFAIALLLALDEEFDDADRDSNNKLDATELSEYFRVRIPKLMRRIAPGDAQDPRAFLPPYEKRLEVAEK